MHKLFLILLLASALLSETGTAKETADVILVNGHVFTGVAAKPRVEALAIRGDRIFATGSSDEISHLAGPETQSIDLAGATVIPGINDAHNHLDISPSDTVNVEVSSRDPSWSEMRSALAAAVSSAPRGVLLMATMGPRLFHDPAVTRAQLDLVAPLNPVMIITFTGHAAFLNTAALSRFAVNDTQPDPLGGKFERGSDAKLTGVVREYAVMNLERSMADAVSDADAAAQLKKQLEQAAAFGITSIQDMSNAASPERTARLLTQIHAPLRVRIMQMAGTTPTGRVVTDGQAVAKDFAPQITVSGIKWMLDGVPVEGTFTSRTDPSAADAGGVDNAFGKLPLIFAAPEISAMLQEAVAAHQQLMVHVSGSISAAAMLQALESSGGAARWVGQRVRFEHGDGLSGDLIPRAKALGIVVVQNPSHLMGVKEMYGATFKVMQPLKSLFTAGIPVALGSDGPINPYLNILFASLHANRPEEAITREQAVLAYTSGSAYAEFAEQDKGSLQPGKLADLAVLSQDIFKVPPPELPKTTSVLTIVGGKIIYRKSAL